MFARTKTISPQLLNPNSCYIFHCPFRQKIETIKEEKAAVQKMVENLKKQVRRY